jgi:hypothetical protein
MCATTIIAKNGDVILQVLKDTETSVRLLVSSTVLSLASHVFEAMFDGRFAEGQDLSSATPKTIQLTDDNPECMTMLCRLIHLQNSDIPFNLELDFLIDFAILCDKYDCADSVRPWSKIWVSHLQWGRRILEPPWPVRENHTPPILSPRSIVLYNSVNK